MSKSTDRKITIRRPSPIDTQPPASPVKKTRRPKAPSAKKHLRTANEDTPDLHNHGSLFVRMMNTSGIVVPVVASHVANRLFLGYRFIENEPSIPRYHGKPEVCEQTEEDPDFVPRPRMCVSPNDVPSATVLWANFMIADRKVYGNRTDLDWATLYRLEAMLRGGNGFNPDMVYNG
jgi:hypothetical protein